MYYDRGRSECLPLPRGECRAARRWEARCCSPVAGLLRRRCAREKQPSSAAALRLGRVARVLGLLKRRLKVKLKIAFSFYQIATKVGETYMVVYPSSVEATLDFLSFVNLELDGLGLPLSCVRLSSFRAKLLFVMLAPLGVLLLTKVVGGCATTAPQPAARRKRAEQPPRRLAQALELRRAADGAARHPRLPRRLVARLQGLPLRRP